MGGVIVVVVVVGCFMPVCPVLELGIALLTLRTEMGILLPRELQSQKYSLGS